jgi:hypothetical protein
MSDIQQTDWARLAGLIDGEGCVRIETILHGKNRKRPFWQLNLAIPNVDPRIPLWCRTMFGGTIHKRVYKNGSGWRTCYTWYASQGKAERILANCLPYFIAKREQAEIALAFRGTIRRGPRTKVGWLLTPEELVKRQELKAEISRLKHELPVEAALAAEAIH